MLWDPPCFRFCLSDRADEPSTHRSEHQKLKHKGLEPHLSEAEVGKCSGTPPCFRFCLSDRADEPSTHRSEHQKWKHKGLEPHLSEVEVGKCSGTPLASGFACEIGPMSPQPIDLSTKSGSIRG